jgi:PX domain
MQSQSIHLSIPESKTEKMGGKEVTYYIIKVDYDGKKWDVKRRYNDFDDLKKDLAKNNGGIPPMPGKTLWKISGPEFVEQRRVGLEKFLRKLLERQDMFGNDLFLQFLKVSLNINSSQYILILV